MLISVFSNIQPADGRDVNISKAPKSKLIKSACFFVEKIMEEAVIMKVNYDMTVRNFQDMLIGKDGVMGVSAVVEEMKLVNLNQRITDKEKLKLLNLMIEKTSEFEKGWQTVIIIQSSDTIATSSNIDLQNYQSELDKMEVN